MSSNWGRILGGLIKDLRRPRLITVFILLTFAVLLPFICMSYYAGLFTDNLNMSNLRVGLLNKRMNKLLHRSTSLQFQAVLQNRNSNKRMGKKTQVNRYISEEMEVKILHVRKQALNLVSQGHSLQQRLRRIERSSHQNSRVSRSNNHMLSSAKRSTLFNRNVRSVKQVKNRIDPRLERLHYYKETGSNATLSDPQRAALAIAASRDKGVIVSYSHSFLVNQTDSSLDSLHTLPEGPLPQLRTLNTSGTYYLYNHSYSSHPLSPCDVHYISLKYHPECGDDLPASQVKQLLIVSAQRSGSHFIWEMLNRIGVEVHHEGVGPAGAVSWIYAVNAVNAFNSTMRALRIKETLVNHQNSSMSNAALNDTFFETVIVGKFVKRGYVINNPTRLSKQRFRVVLHQVRHPLRVISTLLARCGGWDRYWSWIGSVRGCESITAEITSLKRAMLLYVLWNKHIERFADIRFRTETTSARDVCLLGGFGQGVCEGGGERDIVEPVSAPVPVLGLDSETVREYEMGAFQPRRLQSVASDQADRNGRDEIQESDSADAEDGSEGQESADMNEGQNSESSHLDGNRAETELPIDPTLHVTWDDLAAESIELTNELKVMCLEYGYPLDAGLLPQSAKSREFTA